MVRPSTRVRWKCHNCAVMGRDHERVCYRCKHHRCEQCTRHVPRTLKSPAVVDDSEEEGVRGIGERLGRVGLR